MRYTKFGCVLHIYIVLEQVAFHNWKIIVKRAQRERERGGGVDRVGRKRKRERGGLRYHV